MKQNELAPLPATPAVRGRQDGAPDTATSSRSTTRGRSPASDNAPVRSAATSAAPPQEVAAGAADMVVPVLEKKLPVAAAPAADLVLEAVANATAEEEAVIEEDDARAAAAQKKSADGPGRPLRPEQDRKPPSGSGQGEDLLMQEEIVPVAAALAPMLINMDDTATSADARRGKFGAGSKGAAAGASRKEAPDDNDLIMEAGDRLHRVAVVAQTFIQELRSPQMKKTTTLPKLKPKSRAECERRCGTDGFCDPSNILGCGGTHCGASHDMLY
ncbi:MAG TPA: hypothetical protein VM571_14460 [Noviherbaspirillum sp.]|nr:hypothetical protein [Noviherbaspirillum sp.]